MFKKNKFNPYSKKNWEKLKEDLIYLRTPGYQKNFKHKEILLEDGPTLYLPGLDETRIVLEDGREEASKDMVPQSIAFAKNNIFIGAYCHTKKYNSILFLLNKEDGRHCKTICLPNKCHVGGMSYDEKRDLLWICNSGTNKLEGYPIKDLEEGKISSQRVLKISVPKERKASYLLFSGEEVWIGSFHPLAYERAYRYKIICKDQGLDLKETGDFVVTPPKTQGMEIYHFRGREYFLFSCSHGRLKKSSLYLCESGALKKIKDKPGRRMEEHRGIRLFVMPEMMEGLAVCGDMLYVTYESGANFYHGFSEGKKLAKASACPSACDRICRYDLKKLLGIEDDGF